MSSDFIKMVSEIHNQRYSNQILYLIQNKINCGFFVGFEVPNNISEVISSLKETGMNLQCVCVIDESQINDTDLDIPTITMEELPNFQTKPEIMLHFNDFQTNAFREYFLRLLQCTLPTWIAIVTEHSISIFCRLKSRWNLS